MLIRPHRLGLRLYHEVSFASVNTIQIVAITPPSLFVSPSRKKSFNLLIFSFILQNMIHCLVKRDLSGTVFLLGDSEQEDKSSVTRRKVGKEDFKLCDCTWASHTAPRNRKQEYSLAAMQKSKRKPLHVYYVSREREARTARFLSS